MSQRKVFFPVIDTLFRVENIKCKVSREKEQQTFY